MQGYQPIAEGFWPFVREPDPALGGAGLTYMALIARITRASMLEVLQQDYIRTANAKGLATDRVLLLHALKNAAVPIVTVIGIGIALLICGVVITETVFNIPGLGRLTVDAMLKRDYPIIQGLILVFAARQRAGESADRHLLRLPRSADPLLTWPSVADDLAACRRAASRWRPRSGAIRRSPSARVLLVALIAMALLAPSVRRRPVQDRAGQPAAPAVGALVVRHRPVRPRRVHPHDLRRARLADRRPLGRGDLEPARPGDRTACGYFRAVDGVVMRIMDGLMAIPSILLAIALITLTRPGLGIVIVAIVIPEVPRIVRLVRAVVLSIRDQPYIESAIAGGTRNAKLLMRHILPNTLAPLIVQATYICASAMLIEAGLCFLGAGVPPEMPSWGNIIAQGRTFFQIAPWTILIPGALPGAHRAGGEPAGRRPARPARSAAGEADVTRVTPSSRSATCRPSSSRSTAWCARSTACRSTSRAARRSASSANRAAASR